VTIFIDSLDFEIYQENSTIQSIQLPQVLSVECQFTPIHDFLPKRTPGKGEPTKLINQRNKEIPQVQSATIQQQITNQINTDINRRPLIPFPIVT